MCSAPLDPSFHTTVAHPHTSHCSMHLRNLKSTPLTFIQHLFYAYQISLTILSALFPNILSAVSLVRKQELGQLKGLSGAPQLKRAELRFEPRSPSSP